jgi:flagellar hook-basal body complex protein FliE
MSTSPINPFLPRTELTQQVQKPAKELGSATGEGGFADMLKDAIQDVNKMQNESDQKIASLLKGESQDLHDTILAVQQADSSFRLMMQVRNKIVEAYKEISRSGM